MLNYKKSAKVSLALVYTFMVLLVIATVALPWLVTWYAETMGRSSKLSATVMLTCYPCVPFAVVALLSLRRLIKNIMDEKPFAPQNVSMLRRVMWCCFCAGIIMLVAGVFYMPFYIAGAAAASCGLILSIVKSLVQTVIAQQGDNNCKENGEKE